jgi:DNA-binding transcriptional MocR family regulator
MKLRYARRMAHIKASDIREILKVTQHPEVISLAGGLPAPELFRVAEIAQAAREVLSSNGPAALQYSTTEGDPRLREWIARRLRARWGARIEADDVLVTTGSQQSLDLVAKLFLDEGDEVLCESPTYLGAIQAFEVFRPRWTEVPTDDEGMDLAALETQIAACERPKLLYYVPNFQNPTGRTWSLARRQGLLEVARRYGVPILEDNPYGEVRFEGEAVPSLQSLDTDGLVLVLGTLSKVFCPGLRIGWVAAARPIVRKLVVLKQGADLHTSTLDQMIAARYLETRDLDEDIRRITALYRERRDAMVGALEREMPEGVRFTRPSGGLFLWVELPDGISARALLERCLERQVAFVPGGAFFPSGGHENTLRLNFSNAPVPRIEEGVRRIAAALRDLLSSK